MLNTVGFLHIRTSHIPYPESSIQQPVHKPKTLHMLNVILLKNDPQALEKLANLLAEKNAELSEETLQELLSQLGSNRRRRVIVKRGLEWLALKLEDVILFYTENKLVYVIDRYGKKYLSEKSLGDLQLELDPKHFFRANRQYIININFVKGFKPFEKVKLEVELLPELPHQIVVSQENAPSFRQWMFNA